MSRQDAASFCLSRDNPNHKAASLHSEVCESVYRPSICILYLSSIPERLRVLIAKALGEHNRLAQADLHEELCVAEGACTRLQKVLRASVRALEQGLASVSPEALERAADCLHAARQRDFYGEGGSGQVAPAQPARAAQMPVDVVIHLPGQTMVDVTAGLSVLTMGTHYEAALLLFGDLLILRLLELTHQKREDMYTRYTNMK